MPLSVGVEIEGIALSRRSSALPFPLGHREQLQLISDSFERRHMPTEVYMRYEARTREPNRGSWNVTGEATVVEVTSDSDTALEDARDRFDFEVVSPIFNASHENEWRRQLSLAVDTIGNAVRWKVNRSTSFQVHIGNGCVPFELLELKKIAMFFCCFEGKRFH